MFYSEVVLDKPGFPSGEELLCSEYLATESEASAEAELVRKSFEISDEMLQDLVPMSSEKQRLVQKRRLAEQRLEEKRLRDELGDYDLHLDYN